MAKLESAIIANKFDDKQRMVEEPVDSDNEANKNRLDDIEI